MTMFLYDMIERGERSKLTMFEDAKGRLIIAKVEVATTIDTDGSVHPIGCTLNKPMFIAPRENARKEIVWSMTPFPFNQEYVEVHFDEFRYVYRDVIPAEIEKRYLESTTGIALTSKVPPGGGGMQMV